MEYKYLAIWQHLSSSVWQSCLLEVNTVYHWALLLYSLSNTTFSSTGVHLIIFFHTLLTLCKPTLSSLLQGTPSVTMSSQTPSSTRAEDGSKWRSWPTFIVYFPPLEPLMLTLLVSSSASTANTANLDETPRQTTFCAARQGEETPASRANGYQPDNILVQLPDQTGSLSQRELEREKTMQAYLNSMTNKIEGKQQVNGHGSNR